MTFNIENEYLTCTEQRNFENGITIISTSQLQLSICIIQCIYYILFTSLCNIHNLPINTQTSLKKKFTRIIDIK